MSTRKNKALARDYMKAWAEGAWDKLDALLDDDFVYRTPTPGFEPNKEGSMVLAKAMRAAFPDMRMNIEDAIAEGDLVSLRFTVDATHEGEFQGVPGTGKRLHANCLSLLRVQDGRILEDQTEFDTYGFMAQLGAVEVPATATA